MSLTMPNGVFPTMITPFTKEKEIDYPILEKMIEWYILNGVEGLFAVCQSSEMISMSLKERVELAQFVVEKVAGRVPVVASGHISDKTEDQIEEIKAISATGIDAFVLVTNRLATEDESEEVWKKNAKVLLQEIPDIPLGLYECPAPYKRLLSPELLKWCAQTNRFYFLKDTSCDLLQIQEKIEAVKGSNLKIYNANAPTLLESLKLGVAGYSGIMANFHPDLYVWLTKNWEQEISRSARLQEFLGLASIIERQLYPTNAKYFLQLEGLGTTIHCRVQDMNGFTPSMCLETDQLYQLSKSYSQSYVKTSERP
jgi:4-hydroxy-tetrahydrodipicolinate synthase